MQPVEIISKKRDGFELSKQEIDAFVRGVVDGGFPDYQAAALLMAIRIRGMSEREATQLSIAMARSGECMDLSEVGGVCVDKHSTGGVGDTTTLILAPLVAACGVKVAKMSGRGLGHTGGTLDKLESIPGFHVNLSKRDFIRQVREVGCAVAGQTAELAPADKTLYALRDVTGTVDSLPLIASSILSKKLASGADCVVLDVKTGGGALMPTIEESVELARLMVKIGNGAGRHYSAIVTGMDEPLGQYIGNALEVEEAISVLAGRTRGPLLEISMLLGAHMLLKAGYAKSVEDALSTLEQKLNSGEGLEKFAEMIAAQGGDARVVRDVSRLPKASERVEIRAARGGYVRSMRTTDIGNAARYLGAGRFAKQDAIDPAAGLVMGVRVGELVRQGDVLMTLHVTPHSKIAPARALAEAAIEIGADAPETKPLVYAVIGGGGDE